MPPLVYLLEQAIKTKENNPTNISCMSDHSVTKQTDEKPSPTPSALVTNQSHAVLSTVVEFGTVLVYCCTNSCWYEDSDLKREMVVIQPDSETVD